MKRLKRGKASQSVGGMSDDDKIRLQLYLDVQEYGKQVRIWIILYRDFVNVMSFRALLDLIYVRYCLYT